MTTEKDVKIHVKGLKKSFGHVHVLKGIDAEIKAGEDLFSSRKGKYRYMFT